MTQKERFVHTLKFRNVDRVPLMEIALWPQTRERWVREGMPADVHTGFMHRGCDHFGLEGYETVHIDATGPFPPIEEQTLEETDEHVLFTDHLGRTRRALKSGAVDGTRMSMDTYLDFPVKDRATFSEFRKRYEGPIEGRYPPDWDQVKTMASRTELPLTLLDPLSGTFGYYSMLRNWMGTEGLSYMFYDDPNLVCECLEFLTDFVVRLLVRAVEEIKFDFYYIHEDMSYKNGPLVSPRIFREMFLPHYRRFVEFLKSNGIDVVLVDTDGNHEALIPLFLDAGVDGFGPIERAAGMDPVKIRREYGKSVCMVGGIDKRAIAGGRRSIEEEVDRTILPIVDEGGYIPTIDHAVPPDVSYESFLYYLEVKNRILEGRSGA